MKTYKITGKVDGIDYGKYTGIDKLAAIKAMLQDASCDDDPIMADFIVEEVLYMNIYTGIVDDYDGWFYDNEEGDTVNAVDLGEVVEVTKNADGEWVKA